MIDYEEVDWKDIEGDIKKVDPSLHEIMRLVKLNNKILLPLFKATFSYGELLLDKGHLVIPPYIREATRCQLKHVFDDTIPLALILTNSVEIFVESTPDLNKPPVSIPLIILHQGSMFGVFEAAERLTGKSAKAAWSVSSGARSAVLAAQYDGKKTTDLEKILRSGTAPVIKDVQKDPLELFRWIVENTSSSWEVEVLLIPHAWWKPETTKCPAPVTRFQTHIFMLAWAQASYVHSKSKIDLLIQDEAARKKFTKPSHQLHLQQIVGIASGTALGFEIAQASAHPLGPFKKITETLRQVLRTDQYPIILQPAPLFGLIPPGQSQNHCPIGVFYSTSVFRIQGSKSTTELEKPPSLAEVRSDLKSRFMQSVPRLLAELDAQSAEATLIQPSAEEVDRQRKALKNSRVPDEKIEQTVAHLEDEVPLASILRKIAQQSQWGIEESDLDAFETRKSFTTFFSRCIFIQRGDTT